jgi:hypothetical protein
LPQLVYPWKKKPAVFNAEEATRASELIGTFADINLLPLPGFKPQNHPACSQVNK